MIDESHRRHAESPLAEGMLRGCNDLGVVCETEVVVGAEVDDFTLWDPNRGALRRRDDSLLLVGSRITDGVEFIAIAGFEY